LAVLAGAVGMLVALSLVQGGSAARGAQDVNYPELVPWVHRAGLVVLVGGALAVVWFAAEVVMGAIDMVTADVRVTGRILRTRERPGFEFNHPRNEGGRNHYVAVDSGVGDRVLAWSVSREIYGRCAQGQEITATVTGRLRHVRSVELTR
jgi:hypothetical protein